MSENLLIKTASENDLSSEFSLYSAKSTAFSTRPNGRSSPVKLFPYKQTSTRKEKLARTRALARLTHPAIASYRGILKRNGTYYDVFDSPELLDGDHLISRLTPAALTDELLDLLPALADLHAAGLVHGDLNRSTIRTTKLGQTVILGLETAVLSDEVQIDLHGIATYCAASLGVVPGIPVEVFLRKGNRRINRRLCSAIQGAIGEQGYEPIHSIKDFHDLIVGKAKAIPVRKPPILTANAEYAPVQDETNVATEQTGEASGQTSIAVLTASVLAIATAIFYMAGAQAEADTTYQSEAPVISEAHNDTANLIGLEAWANPEPITLDYAFLANTLIDNLNAEAELQPVTPATTEHIVERLPDTAAVISPPLDLSLFRAQTSAWASAKKAAPAPAIISLDTKQIDRDFFVNTWIGKLTAAAELEPVANDAPKHMAERLSDTAPVISPPLELSLFRAQTSAWASAGKAARAPVTIGKASSHADEEASPPLEGTVLAPVTVSLSVEPISPTVTDTDTQHSFEDKTAQFATLSPAVPISASGSEHGRILTPAELHALKQDHPLAPKDTPEDTAVAASIIVSGNKAPHFEPVSELVSTLTAPVITAPSVQAAPKTVLDAGQSFQDCANCPDMLVLPPQAAGASLIAMAKTEVTVSQYRAFIESLNDGTQDDGTLRNRSVFNPGFEQADTHPVTYVSVEDAKTYAAWLSKETGQTYRLPTLSEWEFAAKSQQGFTRSPSGQCGLINGADAALSVEMPKRLVANCNDRFIATAPAKSFPANDLGLFDMIGNVAEWTASPDGTKLNISKGGSWMSHGAELSPETRKIERSGARLGDVGFRLVREIR